MSVLWTLAMLDMSGKSNFFSFLLLLLLLLYRDDLSCSSRLQVPHFILVQIKVHCSAHHHNGWKSREQNGTICLNIGDEVLDSFSV